MPFSTLDLITTKGLTTKVETSLCEVKDHLYKPSTKDPGSHERSTRDNLYRWTKNEARLCEFNLKLSFLPPRVKLKKKILQQRNTNKIHHKWRYVKNTFQNKFKLEC